MILPQHIGPVNIVPLIPYVSMAVVLAFVLGVVPGLIWLDRVGLALIQDRLGPNRVGPRGLLQPVADGMKLFFKEDITPDKADRRIYYLAPVLALIPALAAGAVVPFHMLRVRMDSGEVVSVPMVVGHVNIGILYVLALASLQVYGIVLGGWSSNNKYSLMGGLRSAAQVVSYELAMSMAVMTGVLMAGSLDLVKIVESQAGHFFGFIPRWNIFQFAGLGFIATVIYLIAMVAETNRAPFDLPEAENELVAGFHTEYSSMKFAMFFMGEYASMLVVSGVATALWLGGWQPLFPFLSFIPGWIWFVGKLAALMLTYVWIRGTLPRLRYDALMALGWKRMLPVALVVLFAVATWEAFTSPSTQRSVMPPPPPNAPKAMGMSGVSAGGGGQQAPQGGGR